MEYTTNYLFKRKSKNFLDWFKNIVESHRMREAEGVFNGQRYRMDL